MKFCCDKFRFFYSGEKSAGLNIRIVKLSKDYIERGNLKIDRTYFVKEGYPGAIDECQKKMAINHCPFCGSHLKRTYESDTYFRKLWMPDFNSFSDSFRVNE